MTTDLKPAREDAPRGPAFSTTIEQRALERRRRAARRRIRDTCRKAGLDPEDLLGQGRKIPADR